MGEAQQLSNSDFRKLLLTPQPGSTAERILAADRGNSHGTAPLRGSKLNYAGPTGGPILSDGVEPKEPKEPRYRDRAAERRLGLTTMQAIAAEDVGAVALSYEESKYLGGDVDHTHLVKGLDYALLNRMRSDQQPINVVSRDEAADGNSVPSDWQVFGPPSFLNPMARAIYRFLVEGNSQFVALDSERFLPRRCAFVYDASDGSDPTEIPTMLLRAKEDCPPVSSSINGSSNAAILDHLAKIMTYISRGKKRSKKLGAINEEPTQPDVLLQTTERDILKPSVPEDLEEDIFGDAGRDYVAERREHEANDGPHLKQNVCQAIFGELSKNGETEPDAMMPQAPEVKVGATRDETGCEDFALKEIRRKTILTAPADDGYAECYPSYNEIAGAVYDSEDDDGIGVAKPTPAEEAAAKHGKREALKEAAKAKSKQASELAKLQQIFEAKGYGNAKAFGNAAGKEGNRASKPSLRVEGSVKKRRI